MTGGLNPNFDNPTDIPVPSDVNFMPYNDEDMIDDYEEPKPKIKIITNGKPKGSRGRPKKK
jgi:hypothetical protein